LRQLVCYEVHPYLDLDDRRLIELILSGDGGAVCFLLVSKCGPLLKSYLSKYSTLDLEFDEFINEICSVLLKNNWKALREFRGINDLGRPCKLQTYITTIGRNFLNAKMEKKKREKKNAEQSLTENGPLYPLNRMPMVEFESWRMMDFMDSFMKLTSVERQVIRLYKLEGKSVSDVADALKMSEANVYTICSRAIKKLRTLYREGDIHA